MKLIESENRADKKRDVKPTVHITLYETISRISYITNRPMKEVAEVFCIYGLNSYHVASLLSKKFRRPYSFSNGVTTYCFTGDSNKIGQKAISDHGERRRITIRFPQDIHDKLAELAFSLDITISSTTTILLDTAIKETDIISIYLNNYVNEHLNTDRILQLKEVLTYIERENYHDETITLRNLLIYISGETLEYGTNFKKVLFQWLDTHTEYI